MTLYRKFSSRHEQKTRGGKRHLRRLQQDSTTAGPLHWAALQHCHYEYNKLGLGPWHWHHRQPPRNIRQLAARHLLTTFFAWQPQLASLAEPVYCAVWIVEPEFAHNSQVVVGLRERVEHYQNNAPELSTNGPALPAEYQQLPGAERLVWQPHPWEVLLEAGDYPAGWPQRQLHLPHHEYHSEGRTFLVVQTGWMWVGQLAAPPAL